MEEAQTMVWAGALAGSPSRPRDCRNRARSEPPCLPSCLGVAEEDRQTHTPCHTPALLPGPKHPRCPCRRPMQERVRPSLPFLASVPSQRPAHVCF